MADEKIPKNLLKLSAAIHDRANVWAQPSIEAVPTKMLDSWSIVKVVEAKISPDQFEFHFVGRDVNECNGAVSSKIVEFDPQRMQGKTQSGRVYQLVDGPGRDADADYVLHSWCRMNQVIVADGTQEFLQRYGISVENLE